MDIYNKIQKLVFLSLKKLKPFFLSSWAIMMTDVVVIIFSYIFTDYLFSIYNSSKPLESLDNTSFFKVGFLIVIYTLVFTIFKIHKSIIRYTNTKDIIAITLSVATASIILVGSTYVFDNICPEIALRRKYLFIHAFFTIVLMTIPRLFIRFIYQEMKNNSRDYIARVALFNTCDNNFFLQEDVLESPIMKKYKSVAVINSNHSKINGMTVSGKVPIVSYKNTDNFFSEIKRKFRISCIIVSSNDVEYIKGNIAQKILDSGLKLKVLNSYADEYNSKKKKYSLDNLKVEDLLNREPIVLENKLISENISGKVVLVTGAAGSIGSEITRQVATYGAKTIILFDNAETPLYSIDYELREKYGTHINIVPFIGSVYDITHLEKCFKKYKPDMVYHAAAYKHVPMMELFPTQATKVNICGSRNVANMSIKYEVDKFVMISTDKAVNPTNIMGATKRIAEMYIQSLFYANKEICKTKFITTRFGNVLGSNGSVVPLFKKQIINGGPITITDPNIERYFMTIPEACSLVLQAGCMGNGGEIYVFDMGKPVKIIDLAKKMIQLTGHIEDDIKIEIIGLRAGEKITEELLANSENTKPTYNDRIMIANVRKNDYNYINKAIDNLCEYMDKDDINNVVISMKHIVPEFISNNSKFEIYDK